MTRELLVEGADIEARNNYHNTALPEACVLGHAEVVSVLLSHHADINARDRAGWTPVSHCVWRDREAVLELLLDCGRVDLEAKPYHFQDTPLAHAARLGRWSIAQLLIRHGANANVRDCIGYAVICAAAEQSKTEGARLLLCHGADVNSRSSNGRTPIMEAAHHGNWSLVHLLIKKRANLNKRDHWGYPIICRVVMAN